MEPRLTSKCWFRYHSEYLHYKKDKVRLSTPVCLCRRTFRRLLPGSGLLSDAGHAQAEAARIGYPVMLKSTAGGGGIGMQLCGNADELLDRFTKTARLAANNFGDARLFLERFVPRARHVEVQIFGDGKGGIVALGERDCSVQRRNQKVVEETPAPDLGDAVRKRLRDAAIALGHAVKYESAGTVEFLYDVDRDGRPALDLPPGPP